MYVFCSENRLIEKKPTITLLTTPKSLRRFQVLLCKDDTTLFALPLPLGICTRSKQRKRSERLMIIRWPKAEFYMIGDAGHSMKEEGITAQLVEACEKYKNL